MASFIPDLKSFSLDPEKRHEEMCYGELFEEVGYGFFGIRVKFSCPYSLLV